MPSQMKTPSVIEPTIIDLRKEIPGTLIELNTENARYWIVPILVDRQARGSMVKAQVSSDSEWYWKNFGVTSPLMTNVEAILKPGGLFTVRGKDIGPITSVTRKSI